MITIKELKAKRVWKYISPDGYLANGVTCYDSNRSTTIKSQDDFLREFYPSGHRINSEDFYPNILRTQEEPVYDANGNPTDKMKTVYYMEMVPRCSFAYQQIITYKQIVHLCGNDIQFELTSDSATENDNKNLNELIKGWADKRMETAFYEAVRSEKITGDTAIVFYLSNGKLGRKVLSYLNDDRIYPHFDEEGKLSIFARSFSAYDDDGVSAVEYLEVWDKFDYYKFKNVVGTSEKQNTYQIGDYLVSGYELVISKKHGFPFCPVAYKRNDIGPCWTFSQQTIEDLELAYSQMSHNNKQYGEPIMVFKGDGDNYNPFYDANGSVKFVSIGSEDKLEYAQAQSASDSFMKQIENDDKMIYEQSFAVRPPEVKAGDLPAAALKILYSPAVEKAMNDASEWDPFVSDMFRIFSFGYGVESENQLSFSSLSVNAWIKPYVHVNESAIMADLAIGIQNKFISVQTASERARFYTTNDELDRLMREYKKQQEADLLFQEMESQVANSIVDTNNNNTNTEE